MGLGKILLGAAAVVVVGLLGIAFAIPREIRVQRSVRVETSPEAAFELVEDLRRHDLWMPWGALETRPQVVFGTLDRGEGATYFWIGDPKTHGTLTLDAVKPPKEISASIDLASVDEAELSFHFEPAEGGVDVSAEFRKDLGLNPVRRYLRASYKREGEQLIEVALARLKQAAESLRPTRVLIEPVFADTVF